MIPRVELMAIQKMASAMVLTMRNRYSLTPGSMMMIV